MSLHPDRASYATNIRATREVVLSAGAVGSPHILLLSGVGPAAQLARFGIPVVADRPGVGEHLIDHLLTTLTYTATPGLTITEDRVGQMDDMYSGAKFGFNIYLRLAQKLI